LGVLKVLRFVLFLEYICRLLFSARLVVKKEVRRRYMRKLLIVLGLAGVLASGGCMSGMRGRVVMSSMQAAVEDVAQDVSPSVVFVVVHYPAKALQRRRGFSVSYGAPKRGRKTCTGLVLDKAGHILIPWKVKADDVERIEVWVGDVEHRATLLKSSKQIGMSILKMDKPDENIRPIPAKSEILATGAWGVIVVPSGEITDYTKFTHLRMCQGIVDGYYRSYRMDRPPRNGDGAPVLSMDGKLAGMVRGGNYLVWKDYAADISELYTLALENADEVEEKDDSKEKDGWLGVSLDPINKEYARLKKMSKSSLWVTHVYTDSPAEAAGMKNGDLIIAAYGEPLRLSGYRVKSYFANKVHPEVGKKFEFTVLRDGRKLTLSGTFEEKPEPKTLKADDLGVTVQSVSDRDYVNRGLFTHTGVLVTDIRKGGAAATSSSFGHSLLGGGDVIVELDGEPTPDIDAFAKVLEKIRRENRETVLVRYYRGHTTGYAGLNLKIGKNDKKEGDK
jgi:serine protease Do